VLRSSRQAGLEILDVFLWLKSSRALILNPAESGKHFSKVSFHQVDIFHFICHPVPAMLERRLVCHLSHFQTILFY
jgi:hypothetical protein